MPGGRPLKFKTPEELELSIQAYFATIPQSEWTWTGLALFLDTSKETLREYKERPEFVDSLKKALLKVENSYELDLKKHGRAGTIFALKNFDWKDKRELEVSPGGESLPNSPEILKLRDEFNQRARQAIIDEIKKKQAIEAPRE